MISIITPVLNAELQIEDCIKSVIDQQCNDVEHIIVDGKSEDNTKLIIKRYADSYKHIRWISENDTGQSNAMNKGIKLAKGEIIGILNSDDYHEPNTLNRVKNVFKNAQRPALVVGNCKVWNDLGELLYVNKPAKLKITDLLMGWSINPHPVNPSAYFYHKTLHDIIGYYDETMHFTMDLDFILRAVKVAKVKYCNETWGNYSYRENTKTANDKRNGTADARYKQCIHYHMKNITLLKRGTISVTKKVHYVLKNVKYQIVSYQKIIGNAKNR